MASNFIIGRDRLRKVLEKLPKVAKAKLQADLTASANELAANMRGRINDRTGTLSKSVRVEPRKDKSLIGALIKAGGPTTTKPVRQGQSATYDYAMGVELGTVDTLATPFFFPEYRRAKTKIKRRASKAVRQAVEDAQK